MIVLSKFCCPSRLRDFLGSLLPLPFGRVGRCASAAPFALAAGVSGWGVASCRKGRACRCAGSGCSGSVFLDGLVAPSVVVSLLRRVLSGGGVLGSPLRLRWLGRSWSMLDFLRGILLRNPFVMRFRVTALPSLI
ncbi:hypothetical protein M5K25_012864 [Dendrobium thyrsiflorum]|uniref:Secreted protein n=1 Tax=Dendrobium thyrsiflorum TaxID=117978 RepID=A0ABD0UYR4_DENTH